MFKRILLPIDVSDQEVAAQSLRQAIELAKLMGSEIRLVAVFNPVVPMAPMDVVPQSYIDNMGDYERQELAKLSATIVRAAFLGTKFCGTWDAHTRSSPTGPWRSGLTVKLKRLFSTV